MNNIQKISNFIPSSPTVNALMKFEEIPVSNYTGVPDISIPFENIDIGIENLFMDISLKYHINNAKPLEKSSEVGAGWNLFAGGVISRTVLGSPDDKIVSYGIGNQSKIGIYFDRHTNIHSDKNFFNEIIEGNVGQLQNINIDKMLFETEYQNKYDAEYDLYQYNFMGYSGRFIIKKNALRLLEVVKLDKNNLKIQVNHTPNFEPISFNITDDYGNVFLFDVLETTITSVFSNSTGYFGETYVSAINYQGTPYNSAFHLSKILDTTNNVKATFTYSSPVQVSISERTNFNKSYDLSTYPVIELKSSEQYLPRISENIVSTISTDVRKLTEIEIIGKGKVNFEYEQGREDSNLCNSPNDQNCLRLSKLKSITTNFLNSSNKNKYIFNYNYHTFHNIKRLYLSSVEKKIIKGGNETLYHKYDLEYYGLPINKQVRLDKWESSKCLPELYSDFSYSSECVSVGLLKSLSYPTQGKAKFIYESNTYSYIPELTPSISTSATEITNFDDNELNWDAMHEIVSVNTFNTKKYAFTVYGNEPVYVKLVMDTSQINPYLWQAAIWKGTTMVQGFGTIFLPPGDTVPESIIMLLEPGMYSIEINKGGYETTYPKTFYTSFSFHYKKRNTNNYRYLFGGGTRIKSIVYFDSNGDVDNLLVPYSKRIDYNYDDLINPKKSSGALVVPEPLFSYNASYYALLESNYIGFNITNLYADIKYSSSRNFLPIQKTRGGDIGYQFVSVSETNKGKSVYQYTSPIEYPNPYIPSGLPPFLPVVSNDFERGNLVSKKVFDNNGNLLNELKRYYTIHSVNNKLGIKVYRNQSGPVGDYLYGGKYLSYEDFVQSNTGVRVYLSPNISNIISYSIVNDLHGIAIPIKEEKINYFQNSTSLINISHYTHNNRDYLTSKKIIFPDQSTQITTYQYAHEKGNQYMVSKNMIGIPLETTVTQNGKLISKSEVKYPTSQGEADLKTSGLPLPISVLSTDLANNAQTKEDIVYTKYDNKGNLLEYKINGITPVTILYGYHQTLPIAKIEGATYEEVKNYFSEDIVQKSNLDTDEASENDLRMALQQFRNHPDLVDFQITTYTYNPLIGVTSITPPSGITEFYKYDAANRLEKVENADHELLREYKYHYKN